MADAVCLSGAGDGRSYLALTQLSLTHAHTDTYHGTNTEHTVISDYTNCPDFISEIKSPWDMKEPMST